MERDILGRRDTKGRDIRGRDMLVELGTQLIMATLLVMLAMVLATQDREEPPATLWALAPQDTKLTTLPGTTATTPGTHHRELRTQQATQDTIRRMLIDLDTSMLLGFI